MIALIIDVHTHFVPEEFPLMNGRTGGDRWPTMECNCGNARHKNIIISGKNFRTVTNQCWNPKVRANDMDRESVDIQVLSPMPELLSYWFDAKDTLEFSRYVNSKLSEFIQANPNRFYGLGMVPLQDPELATKEIKVLKRDYGLKGIEVGSNINGLPIGHSNFDPFFEEAEKEDMAIFIHALHPGGSDRLVGPSVLNALIGFPNENGLAAASLITGGTLEKFPNLKIILSHGGGSLISILPRLTHGWLRIDELNKIIPHSPRYYAEKMYYDTLVYDKEAIHYLINNFGSKQLMIGSDYPFSIREKYPGNWLQNMQWDLNTQQNIKYRNASHFFGI